MFMKNAFSTSFLFASGLVASIAIGEEKIHFKVIAPLKLHKQEYRIETGMLKRCQNTYFFRHYRRWCCLANRLLICI